MDTETINNLLNLNENLEIVEINGVPVSDLEPLYKLKDEVTGKFFYVPHADVATNKLKYGYRSMFYACVDYKVRVRIAQIHLENIKHELFKRLDDSGKRDIESIEEDIIREVTEKFDKRLEKSFRKKKS